MRKTNGYYMAKYLKSNFFVLLCELVIVLLLSLICAVILESQPVWLAPTLATVAYLMAELRFMMAYVATNARHEQELEWFKTASAEQVAGEPESRPDAEPTDADAPAVTEEDQQPEQTDEAEFRLMMAYVATNARHEQELAWAKDAGAEQAESEPESQPDAEPTDADVPAVTEEDQQPKQTDEADDSYAEQEAVGEEPVEEEPVEQEFDEEEPTEEEIRENFSNDEPVGQSKDEQEPIQPELKQISMDMDEPEQSELSQESSDDEQDEEGELEMEAISLDTKVNVDDLTMDEGELATDTLEIGEIDEPSGSYKRRLP